MPLIPAPAALPVLTSPLPLPSPPTSAQADVVVAGSGDYLDTPLVVVMAVGVVVTAWCVVVGLRGLAPGRWTLAVVWALDAVLWAFLVWYLVRSARGEESVGPVWELWAYLVTLVLLPPVGVLWARQERTRWSAFVLAVACFVAFVMAARTNQVWYGVSSTGGPGVPGLGS